MIDKAGEELYQDFRSQYQLNFAHCLQGEITPSEVMLLIRAFDETGDPKIKGAVKLIFEEMPPAASNELQEAYEKAITNGTRIMKELGDIAIAEINVPTPLEKATQEFFHVTRTAHQKMLEDKKLPFSDLEPDATIPPGIKR